MVKGHRESPITTSKHYITVIVQYHVIYNSSVSSNPNETDAGYHVMICVVVYLYKALVAFNLFQKYYINQGEVPEPHCNSMLRVGGSSDCYVTIM